MKMLPIDKANHAWLGAYAALAGWLIGQFILAQFGLALGGKLDAALGCAAAAIGRELYGLAKGRPFDPADLAATLMGGVPVVVVAG